MRRKNLSPRHAHLKALFDRMSAMRYDLHVEDADESDVTGELTSNDSFLAGVCISLLGGKVGHLTSAMHASLMTPILDASGSLRIAWIAQVRYYDLHRWPRWLAAAQLQEKVRRACTDILGIRDVT